MTLEEQSIRELKTRLHLGTVLIYMLRQETPGDAKYQYKQVAIDRLQDQQRQINEVLVSKIKAARQAAGIPEPPPVTVGLKTVRLSGRAHR